MAVGDTRVYFILFHYTRTRAYYAAGVFAFAVCVKHRQRLHKPGYCTISRGSCVMKSHTQNGDITVFVPTAILEGSRVFFALFFLFCTSRLERARELQSETLTSTGMSLFASALPYLGIPPRGDDNELFVRASDVLKSQGRENWPRGRPGPV